MSDNNLEQWEEIDTVNSFTLSVKQYQRKNWGYLITNGTYVRQFHNYINRHAAIQAGEVAREVAINHLLKSGKLQ